MTLHIICDENDLWGLMDSRGSAIIKPQYKSIQPLGENRIAVSSSTVGLRPTLIDLAGNVICADEFDQIGIFYNGVATVKKGGRSGYIDINGTLVISPRFYEAGRFESGLAAVRESMLSKYGYINSSGSFVIPPQFRDARKFEEGLAVAKDETGKGFINEKGAFVIGPKFKIAHSFRESLAAVTEDPKMIHYGFIDKTGEYIIPARFEGADMKFSDGLAAVISSRGFGFIDRAGALKISYKYPYADHFEEGICLVGMGPHKARKYGFIDKEGNWVVYPKFTMANNFRDGLAAVEVGESWGYINLKGEYVWKSNKRKP